MSENMVRLLIADDHNLFREGIKNLLEGEKDIFIVGEADTGESLIKKYLDLKPDIVLADISMPQLTGIEALKKLKDQGQSPKFLFLSMYCEEGNIYTCAKAGSYGLVSKKITRGELIFAIRTVNEGKKYFGVDVTEEDINEIICNFDKKAGRTRNKDDLTQREEQIVRLISEGLTSSEIAERLLVSKRTIDSHRTHLIQKLNLKSLPDLIKYSINFCSADKSG
jgi:two-component system, NarL family, response regulator NreC